MGNIILRGISSALVVTVITLLAGMFWSAMGYGGLSVSSLVDIGLVVSCATAGYRTGKQSGVWFWGGVAALGYVSLSIMLAALFLPVSRWGAVQILVEGGLIGILTGAFGAGKTWGTGSQRTGLNRPFTSRATHWGEEREWDKWDTPSDPPEKDWSVDARKSKEVDEFGPNKEGEWEEWMGNSVEKRNKECGRQEDYRIRAEKNAWWEEDVF
ncbi:TIGR04086 family membrane protein [Desulfitobacterium sp.]|uniref:TIGR04086 family membrane protein n=1 Tax=Desulfitobacterium sp. TaxID=49981 RepID=UPI002CE36218|nr:TIGR04086 family membrane protein [Desulfitobacterium sp.]HVJ49808.1 TIGR04086 family membrane protein [Desulfitobacterium sp.]